MILTAGGYEKKLSDDAIEVTPTTLNIYDVERKINEYNTLIKKGDNNQRDVDRRVKINADLGIQIFNSFQDGFFDKPTKLYEYTDKYYPLDAYVRCEDELLYGVEIKRRDAKFANDIIFPDLRFEHKKYKEIMEHYGQFKYSFKRYYYFNIILLHNKQGKPYLECYLFNLGKIFHNHPELKAEGTINKKVSADINSEQITKNTYALKKEWGEKWHYIDGKWYLKSGVLIEGKNIEPQNMSHTSLCDTSLCDTHL